MTECCVSQLLAITMFSSGLSQALKDKPGDLIKVLNALVLDPSPDKCGHCSHLATMHRQLNDQLKRLLNLPKNQGSLDQIKEFSTYVTGYTASLLAPDGGEDGHGA